MSIRKRESKKEKSGYTYQVYFYYKDKFDKRQYYSKSGFKTKKEAQIHEVQIKNELEENGALKKNYNMKFGQVFNEFIECESYNYSPNTIEHYKYTFRKHLSNNIKNTSLSHLCDYQFMQEYFNSLKDNTYNVNQHIKYTISKTLKYAVKKGYVQPFDMNLIIVKGIRKERKQHAIVDYELFQKAMNDLKPYHAITIAIGYYTGMRIAEIVALNREDIDFDNNTIDINKQLMYSSRATKNYTVRDMLKTSKSRNKIPLAYELKKILLEYIEKNPYDPICSNKGKHFNITNLGKKIKNEYGFTFHDLRHTFASTMYANNIDVKTTQELLRHSSVSTTLNVYTHLEKDKKLDVINNVFNIKNVKNMPKNVSKKVPN